MMNIIIIGEMVTRLSEEFTQKFDHIEWHKIKGLRNIIAHDYFGVDAEEVWDIIKKHLPKLQFDLITSTTMESITSKNSCRRIIVTC